MLIKKLLCIIGLFGSVSLLAMEEISLQQALLNQRLLIAAQQGEFCEVRKLIDQRADVTATDEEGRSPLLWAVHNFYFEKDEPNYRDTVDELFHQNGEMLEREDHNGNSALSYILPDSALDTLIKFRRDGIVPEGDVTVDVPQVSKSVYDFCEPDDLADMEDFFPRPIEQSTSVQNAPETEKEKPTSICKVFFGRNIKNAFINIIRNEKSKIIGACYSFTHSEIARALIDQKIRYKIITDIIVDPEQHKDKDLSKEKGKMYAIKLLNEKGVNISYFLKRGSPHQVESMHHKFFIFYNNQDGNKLLWNGSFNCSKLAADTNWENAMVINDQDAIQEFEKEFNSLKQHSVPMVFSHALASSSSSSTATSQ